MGLFTGIKNAKSSGGGIYFMPGTYLLECNACKTGETREGKKAFFVAEFTILESSNPERPVGTSVSFMVMMDKYLDTALGNIKQCVAALFGVAEEAVDEAGVDAIVGADNPAKGARVKATASNIKTRAGKDFTKVMFSHVEQG